MPTNYNGLPANVFPNLPAAVNIASSTNTTPITVQTSTPHGLTTGDVVIINGHLVNTAANGPWVATVVDATHFIIKWITGANSIGNGVGGATGTSQSTGFGVLFEIPSGGDLERAVSVNTALEALGDRTAALLFALFFGPEIYAGGTLRADAGAAIEVKFGAKLTVDSGATFAQLGLVRHRAPVYLTDADQTIDTSQGGVFKCHAPITSDHNITVRDSTAPAPLDGERMILGYAGSTSGHLINIRWETGGTLLISLNDQTAYAEIQFDAGSGKWRGVRFSGNCTPNFAAGVW